MCFENEYFGSDVQISMMKRARDTWLLTNTDPRYSYYGRMVSIAGDLGEDTAGLLSALVRVQGGASCQYYPANKTDEFCDTIRASGLTADRWEQCWGGQDAYDQARQVLDTVPLPNDLTVECLSAQSTNEIVQNTAELTVACGLMPVTGRIMRGLDVPGVTLVALDKAQKAVATACSYRSFHKDNPYGNHAFWGGLACREDRRGEKIALILGAMSTVFMWEKMNTRGFSTGIKKGNAPSFSVCKKLGVMPSDWTFVGCSDPELFKGVSLSK